MERSVFAPCRAAGVLLGLVLALGAIPAAAQLRPLEPAPWGVFEPGHELVATAGLGVHQRQRASLAGTEGQLVELGNFGAAWRSGRFAMEIGGTVYRLFSDENRFDAPHEKVDGLAGPDRRDSGDYRVATSVLLTPPESDAAALLRFGTRLPTTNNEVGLDRDRTDFFALLAGRLRRGDLFLSAETGVGIHGTRDPDLEQSDVLVYALGAEYSRGVLTPMLSVLGHADGIVGSHLRGSEELAEVRMGIRVGGRYWVQAQWVEGLMEFSPDAGLLLSAGGAR